MGGFRNDVRGSRLSRNRDQLGGVMAAGGTQLFSRMGRDFGTGEAVSTGGIF